MIAVKKSRILILGGSSKVGRSLVAKLGPERAAWTYHRNPVAGGIAFDAVSMHLGDRVDAAGDFSHALILLVQSRATSTLRLPPLSWTTSSVS